MNQTRGRSIGTLLEYSVSEVLNASIDDLIDNGIRFTIVNDEDKEEEVYHIDDGDGSN